MSTTPDAPYRLGGSERISAVEVDVRRLILLVAAIGGDDGRSGEILVLDDKLRDLARDLARDLDAVRAARARVTAFFLGLALAVAGAIYWAGSTTATVNARLDRVEELVEQQRKGTP